jgi:predicted PurR-regulated permease PerM
MPMPRLKSSAAATNALVGIWTVSLSAFIIGTLYWARDLLIPLALAALLAFLLAPLVTRVERWAGRIGAVLLVVTLILVLTGIGGWVLTRQLVDLATKLPDYKENIQTKLRAFKVPTGGKFTKFSETLEELKKDLPGASAPEIAVTPGKPATTVLLEPSIKPAVPVAGARDFEGQSFPARAGHHCSAARTTRHRRACAAARHFHVAEA